MELCVSPRAFIHGADKACVSQVVLSFVFAAAATTAASLTAAWQPNESKICPELTLALTLLLLPLTLAHLLLTFSSPRTHPRQVSRRCAVARVCLVLFWSRAGPAVVVFPTTDAMSGHDATGPNGSSSDAACRHSHTRDALRPPGSSFPLFFRIRFHLGQAASFPLPSSLGLDPKSSDTGQPSYVATTSRLSEPLDHLSTPARAGFPLLITSVWSTATSPLPN